MTAPRRRRLLSREGFREAVLRRDGGRCLVCGAPAVDAHHILDRALFEDGGYYLDNGASVCAPCHLAAERTDVGCDVLRQAARIEEPVLPDHLAAGDYDKWGNPVLPSGQRTPGEMFDRPGVQAMIGHLLHLFTWKVKHPRTHHLPWSPGRGPDDRALRSLAGLAGRDVVATVKVDGENTTLMRDCLYARSLDWQPHPSRTMVRALHARVAEHVPPRWRLCGENLQAAHSIRYAALPDVFLLFSVWDDANVCRPWAEVEEWAELLDLRTAPVLHRGPWDERLLRGLHRPERDGDPCEGYVVRDAGAFHLAEFPRRVGKYVRAGHVQTGPDWLRRPVVPNGFAPGAPNAGGA